MNNKTRIIIGVVIAVLFVIGIVSLVQTQTDVTNSTKITNQNDTQIQNNSTDTIEMESNTVVKYSLNNDKSSKVNTNSENKSVNVAQVDSTRQKLLPLLEDLSEDKLIIHNKTYYQNTVSHSDSLKSQSLEEDHILLK